MAQSCPTLCHSPWNSLGQKSGVGNLSLLQLVFSTQGSNPGLSHCRRTLYQLSHKRRPRTLKWVAYPFSRGSSWPRNWIGVSCTAGGFLTNWAIREALVQRRGLGWSYNFEVWWYTVFKIKGLHELTNQWVQPDREGLRALLCLEVGKMRRNNLKTAKRY